MIWTWFTSERTPHFANPFNSGGLNPGRGLSPGEVQKRVLTLPAEQMRALAWHPHSCPCPPAMAGLGEPFSGRTKPMQQKHALAASGGSVHIQFCLLFIFGMSGLLIIYLNEVSNGRWVTEKYK